MKTGTFSNANESHPRSPAVPPSHEPDENLHYVSFSVRPPGKTSGARKYKKQQTNKPDYHSHQPPTVLDIEEEDDGSIHSSPDRNGNKRCTNSSDNLSKF